MINRTDKITDHFYWYEAFTTSHTDLQPRLPRSCNYLIANQVTHVANLLENLREDLGDKAIHPTSWYRNRALNKRVGGSKTSQHTTGEAVDFVAAAGSWEAYFALDNYDIGQRIIYLNTAGRASRVHVSIKPRGGRTLERDLVKFDAEPLITWEAFTDSDRGKKVLDALPATTQLQRVARMTRYPHDVEKVEISIIPPEPSFIERLLKALFRNLKTA